MKIREISVTKLFDIFNHSIPLNEQDRITIIHGPNGFGKTVILKMVNGLFNDNYGIFRRIPFREFSILFDNGQTLVVKKSTTKQDRDTELEVSLQDKSSAKSFLLASALKSSAKYPFSIIDNVIPELRRIGPSEWIHMPTAEQLSLGDIVERYNDVLNAYGFIAPTAEEPWFEELKASVNTRFIRTERLSVEIYDSRSANYESRKKTENRPAVTRYSDQLASVIRQTLAQYGEFSQSLDRTFPARVINKSSFDVTYRTIRSRLDELEKKRSHLMEVGLLDRETNIDFQIPGRIKEDARRNVLTSVLGVYVDDMEKKLDVFDEISAKIDLLKSIINNRFFYKEMFINKERGFLFTGENGNPISPNDLSSGEQHELILFYELLFEMQPDSLILIDEPELSLHVAWQQKFLTDLRDIISLANFDVLIATHSPEIIHDRWDLTVRLKGPRKK